MISNESIQLKIVTFNCNGLKYINTNRVTKIRSIAEYIVTGNFDIVCLQEIYTVEDYDYLQTRCKSYLPYCHWYTNTSFVGTSGLMTMARWPLRAVHIHHFRLQGCPFKFYRGDWFVGKSIGYARLVVGNRPELVVHVFNTHLVANYGGECKQSQYAIHRLSQAYEVAHYIETMVGSTSTKDSMLVLCGDLNTFFTELGYDVIQSRLSLFDCHPCETTCVCYSANRTAAAMKNVCPRFDKIDYVMLRLGPNLMSMIDVFKENGLDANEKHMSDHIPRAVKVSVSRGGGGNEAKTKDERVIEGQCSQTACLKYMRKQLVTYLRSQSYRCCLFALLINLICVLAFAATVFIARPSPLEATLMMLLYLFLLYTVCIVKVTTLDSEWKGIQRMLTCVQLDLSRYNTHSVLLLESDINNGSI